MILPRKILVGLLVLVVLMAIIPPWTVREGRGSLFGPPHAGGYAFIFSPPSGGVIATLDIGRLAAQYIGLAAVVAIALAIRKTPKRKNGKGNSDKNNFNDESSVIDQQVQQEQCSDQLSGFRAVRDSRGSQPCDNLAQGSMRWWHYQSLKSVGFQIPNISVPFILIAALTAFYLERSPLVLADIDRMYIMSFLITVTMYIVATIIGGYIVWQVSGRNKKALVVSSCIAPLVLLGVIQIGNHRIQQARASNYSTSESNLVSSNFERKKRDQIKLSTSIPEFVSTDYGHWEKHQLKERASDLREKLMASLVISNQSNKIIVEILNDYYESGMPWLRTDRVVSGLPNNLIGNYERWRQAEIEAGYDPKITEIEATALDVYHEVLVQVELYGLKNNDRYPAFKQWSNFPVNPFTRSNRIARRGTTSNYDGWSYDESIGRFRLVLPQGVTCRGLGPDDVEIPVNYIK